MKIDNLNNKMLGSFNNFKIKKIAKAGKMMTCALAATLFIGGCVVGNKDEIVEMIPNFEAAVSLDSVNDMGIVINDSDCSDEFFDSVCQELSKDGLDFQVSRNNNGIYDETGVVVTLDQQYSSGPDTIIFAPNDNSRLGDSDSLSLAMQAAFKQNGFEGNSIVCGKSGYREEADGSVVTSIPTETEDVIDLDSDISFVTISFGTGNVNPKWVAKSIENGLVRQKYYLDNHDNATDLIYRAKSNEDVMMIADYFGADVSDVVRLNNITDKMTYDSQAIINPSVEKMEVFNPNSEFSLGNSKTKAY